MNQQPENDTEAIRSDIDTTRQRMDNTLDALGERLQGRHLVDEIVGFFRSDIPGDGKVAQIREKISRSAGSAAHAVADSVKANPMPAILIGAGVVWMIYASQRKSASGNRYEHEQDGDFGSAGRQTGYDPDAAYDQPLEYPSPVSERSFAGVDDNGFAAGDSAGENASARILDTVGSKLDHVKEKASDATRQAKEQLSTAGDQVRQKTRAVGEQARAMGSRVLEGARRAYDSTRQRVVTTADQHPLEVGLACLAAGIAAGLTLPTPERVNRLAGPTMDRLRQRTRAVGTEVYEKGKRVVNAAGSALKSEAEAQGLSLDRLRQKAGAVAERTKGAATESARQEGIMPGTPSEQSPTAENVGDFAQPGNRVENYSSTPSI